MPQNIKGKIQEESCGTCYKLALVLGLNLRMKHDKQSVVIIYMETVVIKTRQSPGNMFYFQPEALTHIAHLFYSLNYLFCFDHDVK